MVATTVSDCSTSLNERIYEFREKRIMPIYEYECPNCGEKFEAHRKIADSDSEIKCPRCGKKQPRRIFSTFGMASSGKSCVRSSG
jgi:putative FmdB family regulatory protein